MSKNEFLKYRTAWMGFAIIWVVVYHYGLFPSSGVIYNIVNNIQFAVDIFIFASGIGCYYSLEKDSNIAAFMRRRFFRIMPTYWVLITFWCIYQLLTSAIGWRQIIGNYLCIQSLTEQGFEFNWYISAIWIYYILAPLFKSIVDNSNSFKKNAAYIILFILISFPFWYVKNWIITLTRLPVFFVGMCFAHAKEEYMFTKKKIAFSLIPITIGILLLAIFYKLHPDVMWACGYFFYPGVLIVPSFCIILSFLFSSWNNNAVGMRLLAVLNFLGKYSLPIYLTHEFIRNVLLDHNVFNLSYFPLMFIGLVLIVPVTFMVYKLGNSLEKVIRKSA